ncbi:MAG: hypothetical protein GY906_09545 [bacterium]|nr:hypothetical protein [bacterium]
MNMFTSDDEYKEFLTEFKNKYESSPAAVADGEYFLFLKNRIGLNGAQAQKVVAHTKDSIEDIEAAIHFKAMLALKPFSSGSSSGTVGFGYSSGFAADHVFGESFTYTYHDIHRSAYFSPPSPHFSSSHVPEASTSSNRGIYFLGKTDRNSLKLDVIVCFEDGSYKEFEACIALQESERYLLEK